MLKEIGKQKIILGAVVVVAVILILILLISDHSKPETYADKEYPVTVKSQKSGGLIITLDGSATGNLSWQYDESPEVTDKETPVITYTVKDSGKNIIFYVTPHKSGYSTIKASKTRTVNEVDYPVANIYLDIVVSESEKGYTANLASTDEDTSNGKIGAADSNQPYYIVDNTIYFPMNSDWKLFDATTLDPEDGAIVLGVADNGGIYYRVISLDDNEQKDLVLKSESLKKEIKLKARYNENNQIVIENL